MSLSTSTLILDIVVAKECQLFSNQFISLNHIGVVNFKALVLEPIKISKHKMSKPVPLTTQP